MTLEELHQLLNRQYGELLEHTDQGTPVSGDYLLDMLMTGGEALNHVPEFKGGTYFKLLTELAETQLKDQSVQANTVMEVLRSAVHFIEAHYEAAAASPSQEKSQAQVIKEKVKGGFQWALFPEPVARRDCKILGYTEAQFMVLEGTVELKSGFTAKIGGLDKHDSGEYQGFALLCYDNEGDDFVARGVTPEDAVHRADSIGLARRLAAEKMEKS